MSSLRIMKAIVYALVTLIVVSSCSTSNDVVHHGIIQKRKYRQGFHINVAKQRERKIDKLEDKAIGPVEEAVAEAPESVQIEMMQSDIAKKKTSDQRPFLPENTTPKTSIVKGPTVKFPSILSNKDSIESEHAALEPEIESGKTITGVYKRKGRIALILSLLYVALRITSLVAGFLGMVAFSWLLLGLTLVTFIAALIMTLKNRKYSKAAKWGLWILIITILAFIALNFIGSIIYAFLGIEEAASEVDEDDI